MVKLIDELERLGLVKRRTDPSDRRGHQIEATPKGATVLLRATRAILVVERDFLAGLDDVEQRDFRRLLTVTARLRPRSAG